MTPTTPALIATAAAADGAVLMSPSEALDIVHELACLNQIDDLEALGDAGLAAQALWQRAALDRLGLLLHEHAPAIDVHLPLPSLAQCAPIADWLCAPERDMDPHVPSNAVRICLELAQDAALEAHECGSEPVLIAGRQRQQRAFAIVRAFLSLHAEAFDAILAAERQAMPASGTALVETADAAAPRARAAVLN